MSFDESQWASKDVQSRWKEGQKAQGQKRRRDNITRERVDHKGIKVDYIKTSSNVADILTKGLSAPSTSASAEALGLQTMDSILNPWDQTSFYLDAPDDNSMTQEDLEALVYGN